MKEERTILKRETENLNRKFVELTEDELEQVTGGRTIHAGSDETATRGGTAVLQNMPQEGGHEKHIVL